MLENSSKCFLTSKGFWKVCLSAKWYKNLLESQEFFNKDVLASILKVFANHRSDSLDNVVDEMLEHNKTDEICSR